MKTACANRFYKGLLLLGLIGAGVGLVGCADEYAAYPGYRGGYYASYGAARYPYYGGYGYGYPYGAYGYPYRAYGPYYGSPYYGGASVVISGSRNYYTYRDRYGRVHTSRDLRRNRSTTRKTQTQSTHVRRYDNDDEQRYYSRP
jgi:hypothetical protein